MSVRDLDLVIGGLLVALATLLARLADPSLAIVMLMLAMAAGLTWLGEERLEMLWREYSRTPADAPVRTPRPVTMPRHPERPVPGRVAGLAPARLVKWH